MVAEVIQRLAELADDIGPACRRNDTEELTGLLPPNHARLLQQLNGLTVFHGAFRLFGLRPEAFLDFHQWNEASTWKFAWDERVEPFLIFGETGWGDQYAYRLDASGALEGTVYFLEATMLRPEPLADSFDDFLRDELLRNATKPYDEMTVLAHEKLGPLPAGSHWVFSPPIALGGPEEIENVIEMPAVTAMVYAGDLATALQGADPEGQFRALLPWTDHLGRSRLDVEIA